jgi:Holliday junction DNA helicase RuvB
VLAHREGLEPPLAEEIAAAVDGVTQDVRDAVRVGRLASQVSVKRAMELPGLTGMEVRR